MRSIPTSDRRSAVVRRHLLGGAGTTVEQVVDALVCLHATDPATVYLSVLARARDLSVADVAAAMYERRSVVRWLAMRRTLFVFPLDLVPAVQAAVSTPLAARLRTQLARRIERNGTEPPIDGDPAVWLAEVEEDVARALAERGSASGAQLGAAVPRLRTVIPPRAPSEARQTVTSPLLAMTSADGRMVRGSAVGAWTTRAHRWEPVDTWFPGGVPAVDVAEAEAEVARRYLRAFGPALPTDLEWWTGWTKATTRRALSRLPVDEVDLDGATGIVLGDEALGRLGPLASEPVATLLPALDPTAMGWKERAWYTPVDPARIHDRFGNVGATVWWDGEIVGGWAVGADGEVRTAVLVDRGAAALAAVEAQAAALTERLAGTVVVPVFRTPLERELTA